MNSLPESELIRYLQQIALPGIDDPQPSNRGVIDPTQAVVFSHLDFLTFTTEAPRQWGKHSLSIPFLDNVLRPASERHGIKNYRYGANLDPVGTYFWNEKNSQLPGYVVLTGEDLGLLRSLRGMSDDGILKEIAAGIKSVTRIDFAVNINRGHPRDALKEWNKGRVETRVKTAERIDGHGKKKGYTVYFGSRQSKRMIRCYDKAAELKLLHEVLTRIEMQSRDVVADNAVKAMKRHGVKVVGKQMIRDFIKFPKLAWWNEAVEGDDLELQLQPKKETSFERWLMEQVYPAIEKRMLAGEEQGAIDNFARALMALYGDLGSDASQS